MSMEKIALWPSSSQKVENSTKETCIMPSTGMLRLRISYCNTYGLTLFIHPIYREYGGGGRNFRT